MPDPQSTRPSYSDLLSDRDKKRFWRYVKWADGDACWLWSGSKHSKGYGMFRIFSPRESFHKAHRVAWELTNGRIEDGLTIDHLCRVRLCVNPKHLEPVTSRENTLRGVGITARCARKTHCKRGHAFTTDNTYVVPTGGRKCRACNRVRMRSGRAAEREAANKVDVLTGN